MKRTVFFLSFSPARTLSPEAASARRRHSSACSPATSPSIKPLCRGRPSLLRPSARTGAGTPLGKSASSQPPAGGRPHPSEGCWQDFLPLAGDAGSRTSSTEATRSEEVKLFFLLLFSLGNSQMKWTSLAVRRNSHAVIELKDV
jgi:hypothetical protein